MRLSPRITTVAAGFAFVPGTLTGCGAAQEQTQIIVSEDTQAPVTKPNAWLNVPCEEGHTPYLEVIPKLQRMVASCAIFLDNRQKLVLTSTAGPVTITSTQVPFKNSDNMYWLGYSSNRYFMSQESGAAVISPSAKVQDMGNWLLQVQSIGSGTVARPVVADPVRKANVMLDQVTKTAE